MQFMQRPALPQLNQDILLYNFVYISWTQCFTWRWSETPPSALDLPLERWSGRSACCFSSFIIWPRSNTHPGQTPFSSWPIPPLFLLSTVSWLGLETDLWASLSHGRRSQRTSTLVFQYRVFYVLLLPICNSQKNNETKAQMGSWRGLCIEQWFIQASIISEF